MNKTDKIRGRIEKIKQIADQSSGNALSHQLKKRDVPALLDAIEAVVEECEPDRVTHVSAEFIVDIIANELDVEEE